MNIKEMNELKCIEIEDININIGLRGEKGEQGEKGEKGEAGEKAIANEWDVEEYVTFMELGIVKNIHNSFVFEVDTPEGLNKKEHLEDIYLINLHTFSEKCYSFANSCPNLKYIDLPKLENVGEMGVGNNCKNLKAINVPKIKLTTDNIYNFGGRTQSATIVGCDPRPSMEGYESEFNDFYVPNEIYDGYDVKFENIKPWRDIPQDIKKHLGYTEAGEYIGRGAENA